MASHAPELAGLGAVASLVYNASAAQLQPTSLGAHVRASSGSRWARAQRALRRAGGERAGGVQSCFDLDAEYVVCADQTGCGLGDTALAWDFQVTTRRAAPLTAHTRPSKPLPAPSG